MTTVEDPVRVDVQAPERRIRILERPKATTGKFSWVTTVDHKKIAIMYATLALCFFVVGGIEALFIRLQLAHWYVALFTPVSSAATDVFVASWLFTQVS